MKRTLVQRIADAVLYEGYILYPYRPSFKNRQRWTFGGLYPPAYCQAQRGSDAASSQTECLVHGDADAVVQVTVRFLQGMQRQVKQATSRRAQSLNYRPVDSLQIGERLVQTWQ